jgi:hypothetical protein
MCVELIGPVLFRYAGVAARSDGTCGGFIWIGLVLWFVPSLIAGWQLARANAEFMQLYRELVDPGLPTYDELAARATMNPWIWWSKGLSVSWQMRVAQRQPGATPALESARRRVLRWRRMAVTVVFAGVLIPFVICLLAGG